MLGRTPLVSVQNDSELAGDDEQQIWQLHVALVARQRPLQAGISAVCNPGMVCRTADQFTVNLGHSGSTASREGTCASNAICAVVYA